jgi:hypothetical protein
MPHQVADARLELGRQRADVERPARQQEPAHRLNHDEAHGQEQPRLGGRRNTVVERIDLAPDRWQVKDLAGDQEGAGDGDRVPAGPRLGIDESPAV